MHFAPTPGAWGTWSDTLALDKRAPGQLAYARRTGCSRRHVASLLCAVMGADDEGEEWNPPPKTGILGRPGTGKGLFGWLPAISEAERKQAVLVDSESDAEYDDDNRHVGAGGQGPKLSFTKLLPPTTLT